MSSALTGQVVVPSVKSKQGQVVVPSVKSNNRAKARLPNTNVASRPARMELV